MNTQYVRLTNSVTDFGRLIPLSDFTDSSKLQNYIKESPNTDWYSSLFTFGEEAKQYFEKNNNSIKGYLGKATTNTLVFDFDSKVDLNTAKEDAIALLMQLREQGIDVNKSVKVFFSGSKGFHVELYTKKFFTPDECKDLSLWIKRIFKLPTLDTVIYNTTRLYRINNTINPKSKLYKIELEPEDLTELTIDQIKEKAKSPTLSNFIPVPTDNLKFIDAYKALYMQKPHSVVVESLEEIDGIRGIDTIDFNECPRTTPRCYFALSKGIMKPGVGERNVLFLRLAAYYRNQGMAKEVALNTLVGIAELNAKLYPEAEPYTKSELENTVIKSVYGSNTFKQMPGASGASPENELLRKYCEALNDKTTRKCCLHSRAENRETTVQIESVSDSFEQFASNFEKNTVKTGIGFIDDNMNIAIGTTTLLVGATGSGKTTAALNIMENANALGLHTVFFSLDMHKNLIYLKLAQKLTNYTQQQILDFYKYKNYDKINLIKKAIAEKYGKTFFDFSSTLTLDQMRDKIFNIEDENKVKVKLVVVDYASRITGQFSDTFANANYNALKSTEIANITDAAWIFISQISRNTGDGVAPLRTKRAAKDSGSWEESATNVITVWRPWMGDPERDHYMRMFLAKNRMGREVETILKFDGSKGLIRDMDLDEHSEYSSVLEKEEREYLKSRFGKN
jgi:KaiC/GvpD/RAD55 family RecA-like ATPase/RimJ/RimL family protein N-acetyltransferase